MNIWENVQNNTLLHPSCVFFDVFFFFFVFHVYFVHNNPWAIRNNTSPKSRSSSADELWLSKQLAIIYLNRRCNLKSRKSDLHLEILNHDVCCVYKLLGNRKIFCRPDCLISVQPLKLCRLIEIHHLWPAFFKTYHPWTGM